MSERKNWVYAAGLIWPKLVEAALDRELVTYGQLAPEISTNPLNVGRALGPIQDYCLDNKLAPLTAVVVGKGSGAPGRGFIAWDVDDIESALDSVAKQNWDLVGNPFAAFGPNDDIDTLATRLVEEPDDAVSVYRLVPDRGIAQRIFRRALLLAYEGKCAFCQLSFESALEAAHIVGWSKCSAEERLDVRNGVLLCATHHKLYDQNLFRITSELDIQYYDSDGNDGCYGPSDRYISLEIHGKKIHHPASELLRPGIAFLARRKVESED
jgi:putative restriction endonuclease